MSLSTRKNELVASTKREFKFGISSPSGLRSQSVSSSSSSSANSNSSIKSSKRVNLVRFNNLVYESIEVCLSKDTGDYLLNGSTPTSTGSQSLAHYGFTIAGYCPCYVDCVVEESVAFKCGLRRCDLIMKINDVNCCRATLKTILSLIKSSSSLTLVVYRLISNGNKKHVNEKLMSRPGNGANASHQHAATSAMPMSTIVNASSLITKQRVNKKKRVKFLAKLFRPSMWLSCASANLLPSKIGSCAFNSETNKTLNPLNSTYYHVPVDSLIPQIETKQQHQPQQQDVKLMGQDTNKFNQVKPENSCYNHYQSCSTSNNQISNTFLMSGVCAAGGDTGYESLSRLDSAYQQAGQTTSNYECFKPLSDETSNDYTIQTVTNTTNSYSDCDLTIEHLPAKSTAAAADQQHQHHHQHQQALIKPKKSSQMPKEPEHSLEERFNETRTKLIGDLIEMDANFVSYLSLAVATFSRPLRGFFIKQQDYFSLFQNIEKILVISENFLRSMDKWTAFDLYTRIGQLYSQKISLFREAFIIYTKGYQKSKSLLNELKCHSKQFRLFLKETQSSDLTLTNLIDLPIVHLQQTLDIFKQIRRYTCESKRNPSEAPHIDSVIFELRKILLNLNESDLNKIEFDRCYDNRHHHHNNNKNNNDDEDVEDEDDDDEITSSSFFMDTVTEMSQYESDDDQEATYYEQSLFDLNQTTIHDNKSVASSFDDENTSSSCCSKYSSTSSNCCMFETSTINNYKNNYDDETQSDVFYPTNSRF